MQRLQAFKFELMQTGEQQRLMRRFAGSCRFVYNKALALQKDRNRPVIPVLDERRGPVIGVQMSTT
jgi:transposase